MNIWIIDHYAQPEKYKPLIRQTLFAKNLIKMGHTVRIFCASTVHNSSQNLITDCSNFKEEIIDGIKYTYVRCHNYEGNSYKRVFNMYEFAYRVKKACNYFAFKEGSPDSVLSCSMTLQACKSGIIIGHKYGARVVAQITDLWPESLIAYGIANKYNPLVIHFRRIEKWIYVHADYLVFSLEGAYEYIKEQGWENIVPKEKIAFINNGIDTKQFEYNKEHFQIQDDDLNDEVSIKIIYTGSIRKANQVDFLIDVAKQIRSPDIKILLWGSGDEESVLKKRVKMEKINNVKFKGKVEKKYIPYIVSKADYNFLDGKDSSVLRYGLSANKIFDYFAAGKPVLTLVNNIYNPIISRQVGIPISNDPTEAARKIDSLTTIDKNSYLSMCENALEAAKEYDFKKLTKKLVDLL